jgi:hypothetical protein
MKLVLRRWQPFATKHTKHIDNAYFYYPVPENEKQSVHPAVLDVRVA